MRTKLIAVAVASLFASSPAWGEYDTFVWSGSAEAGGRGVSTDGGTRNGAYGLYPSRDREPFTGPADEAKAQEYQNVDNGVIGVIDARGSSKNYYLRFFGENFGRDDQYVDARGGGYDVFKAQVYQDRMPHNLSWNAITPLWNSWSNLQQGPAGTYPQAQNPATWNTFNYGLQRNTTGGAVEVSARSPFFFRADYNEVETTGIRPQSAQLGTGSGNGLIEFGAPVEYKTKNAIFEAGYAGRSWNFKVGFLDSKFSNSIDAMQWTNFYMRSALDTSLLPPDNELKKWSLHASVRELPLDSTFVLRASSEQADRQLRGGIQRTQADVERDPAVQPPARRRRLSRHHAELVDVRRRAQDVVGAGVAHLHPDEGARQPRLLQLLRQVGNDSTQIDYAAGGLGADAANCPNPGTGIQTSTPTRFCISAVPAPELFAYTKQEAGIDLIYRIGPRQKLVGNYTFLKIDARPRDFATRPRTTASGSSTGTACSRA